MSHTLKITDGTTDSAGNITFTSGDMYLAEYSPRTAVDLSAPIKEQARVGFRTSIATIQSNVATLNRLFYQAASYQRNGTGRKIYVQFDPGDSGTLYRSTLYAGALHPTEDNLGGEWGANNLEMDLEWTRDPYWEGALTQIPLASGGSASTDAVTIYNHDDAGHNNWVSIASTDVAGDLPASLKVTMVNATTDSQPADEIYIFHNVYSNPSTFPHILEGESASSYGDTDSATTTDATASNLAYKAIKWNYSTEAWLATWVLPSSDLSAAAGGHFAILARWAGQFPYTDCWLRFGLYTLSTTYPVWRGNLSLVSSSTDGRELSMLDTLRLPPYLPGQSTYSSLQFAVFGKRPSSTDNTINLDYIQLSPISGDSGWLRFKSVSQGVDASLTFVHDDTEGMTYRKDASGDFRAEFTQYGGPILLVPGQNQRLYFNSCDYTGTAAPLQAWNVQLWYRPRRSSI